MGIGTGANLQYYNGPQISELVGVDWSENMLMKAFGKLDDLKEKQKDVDQMSKTGIDITKDEGYKGVAVPKQVKLVRADCVNLE